MGRETVIPKLLPPPEGIPDYTDTVAEVVEKREWRFLNALALMFLRFRNQGLTRQAEIVQDITLAELDRLNPQDQWAVENGDSKPEKKRGGFSGWWDSFGSI